MPEIEKKTVGVVDPTNPENNQSITAVTASLVNPLIAYMREANPDMAEMGDDELMGAGLTRLQEGDQLRNDISKLFSEDPLAAEVLREAAARKSLIAGLAAVLSPEEYAAEVAAIQDGTPEFAARQQKLAGVQEKQAKEAEVQAAIDASSVEMDRWAAERGLTEEQIAEFERRMIALDDLFNTYKFTAAELEKMYQMLFAEEEIAAATEDAATAARNEKIVQKKKTLADKGATPLPADIGSGGMLMAEPVPPIPPDIAELENIAKASQNGRKF